jgi:hypothetical protein
MPFNEEPKQDCVLVHQARIALDLNLFAKMLNIPLYMLNNKKLYYRFTEAVKKQGHSLKL